MPRRPTFRQLRRYTSDDIVILIRLVRSHASTLHPAGWRQVAEMLDSAGLPDAARSARYKARWALRLERRK